MILPTDGYNYMYLGINQIEPLGTKDEKGPPVAEYTETRFWEKKTASDASRRKRSS